MEETVHDETMESFSAGRVLSRTFSVFFGNFPHFMALALLVYVPYFLLLVFQVQLQSIPVLAFGGSFVMTTLLALVLGYVATAAMIYGVFQQLGGERVSLTGCISVALGRLLPVVFVSIIVSLATGIATLLLIIPGIIVYLMYFVAVPVTVVERASLDKALDRSRNLTSGHRLGIFGVLIVLGIIGFVIGMVSLGVTMAVSDDASGTGVVPALINTVVTAITTALQAVASAVTYHDLRVEKEGIGLGDLMQVFE